MNKDKKLLYILSLVIFALLLAAFFVRLGSSKIVGACLLAPLAAVTWLLIKKRRSMSINKKEVLLLSTVISVIYVILFQMTGMFFEFYKNPYFVNKVLLLDTIIPLTVIIVATEVIRFVFLSQNNKGVSLITYFSCVIAEVMMFSGINGIISFNRFMDLVGLTLFPALCANLYYHYVSKSYGMLPNIVFRIITTLYIYFIPTVTGMSDALASCIKIIFPIFMIIMTSAMFEKQKKNAVKKGKKIGTIGIALTLTIIISVAMLISCQFRFGALVIATESMTGEINKGDMIIYERYEKQEIEVGQVIVFLQNDARVVHRVVEIKNIDNEIRYITKGDANEDIDNGHRLKTDIVGLTDVKIAYIGYPTLWLREILGGNE